VRVAFFAVGLSIAFAAIPASARTPPAEPVHDVDALDLWPMSDAADDPETDRLTFQWFVNYNVGHGWALTTAPLNLGNWNADSGNEWTVPLGFGFSRTTVFNRPPDQPRSSVLLQRQEARRRGGAAASSPVLVPLSRVAPMIFGHPKPW
jgi:hypothetical protein